MCPHDLSEGNNECARTTFQKETCVYITSPGVCTMSLCTLSGLDCWLQIVLFSHGYQFPPKFWELKFSLVHCPPSRSPPVLDLILFPTSPLLSFPVFPGWLFSICIIRNEPERVSWQRVATVLKSPLCTHSQSVLQAHGRGGHSLCSSLVHLYQVFLASGPRMGFGLHQV